MTIELNFDKSLVGLAGNPFGKKSFERMVNIDIPDDDSIVLVFPDNIKKIASSFVQGFFSKWVTEYGIEYVKDHIVIETPYENLKEYILDNIYV